MGYKEKFTEMFFIQEGEVHMYNKFEEEATRQNKLKIQSFMTLPQYSFFGDY